MKKAFILLSCLALMLSCMGVEKFEYDTPPHLSGGLFGQDVEEEDEGDFSLGDDDSLIVPEDTWAENQPTGAPMTISVMSYNVGKFNKFKSEGKDGYPALGHDSYPEVATCINYANADVVGLNEVNKGQQTTLATKLGTEWAGQFAYANSSNYGNAIVFNKASAVVKNIERVNIPKTADAGETRSMGVIEFEDYVFCVVHLDHKSDQARNNGAKIVTDWVRAKYGFGKTTKPVFLVGDMNCTQTAVTIKYFEKFWTRISQIGGTFPSKGTCIDYIFVFNNGIKYEVDRTEIVNPKVCEDARLASDHYGVYTEVTFNKQK